MASKVIATPATEADATSIPPYPKPIALSPQQSAESVVSEINAQNTIAVDEGTAVKEATGSFVCKRFGDLNFKFKAGQILSTSTVVLKWHVSGRSDAHVVGSKGKRTTKQAINAAVLKLVLGPIVAPLMMGAEAKEGDNQIELTVWSEQLYKLNACPGVTIDWSFEVKDGRKVHFNVQHVTDLVKSLKYSEELAKAWTEKQHQTKSQLQQLDKEERARVQQEVQEYQVGIDTAKSKAEELKRELKLQADVAHKKLTKLLKDQKITLLLNATKDEHITSLEEKVTDLEAQRLGYAEQVGALSDCLQTLQAEKTRCVQQMWKEREVIAEKDQELSGQKQTLRALNKQLEKYRAMMTEYGGENKKLADQIAALEERIKLQEATRQSEKRRFTEASAQQKRMVNELRSALTKASDESVKQLFQIGELDCQKQTLKNVMKEKDAQIVQIRDKYNATRVALGHANSKLDAAKLGLVYLKKALQTAEEERSRVAVDHQDSIAALRLQLTEAQEYAKRDLSDQTLVYKDLQCQLQKERLRCAKLGDANSALRQSVTKLNVHVDRANRVSTRTQSTATQLEKDVQQLRDNLREHEAKAVAAAKLASTKHVADKQDAATQLAELKASLQLLNREHDAEIKRQRIVLDQQRSSIATLQSVIRDQKAAGAGVGMAVGDVDAAIAKASSVFETLNAKSTNAMQKLTHAAEQQIATLRRQLAHQQNRTQGFSLQLESTRADLKSSNVINGSLQMQNRSMVVQLAAAKQSLANVAKQLNTCQIRERLLTEQCSEFEFGMNRKARHLLSYQTIVGELQRHLQAEKAKTAKIRSQVCTLLANSGKPPEVDVLSVTGEQPAEVTLAAAHALANSVAAETAHPDFRYSAELKLLEQMGYGPPDKMISMLVQFNGNVQKIVHRLLR